MKYVVLVGDGMADYPLRELDGRTPLEAAKIPNMDFIAEHGLVGIVKTIPNQMAPASDVANLSILGYDPLIYYSGRGPLEAANKGIELSADEIAFRCNLVTVEKDTMVDYSAGHISTKEATILIEFLNKELGSRSIRFHPGVSYRHLTVIKGVRGEKPPAWAVEARCTPPHDITGQKITKYLPKGKGAEHLVRLMERSKPLLKEQEINQVRIDLGENPANMIWLWGQGIRPNMPKFIDKYGIGGSIISAVDLVKGIGKIIGLEAIEVPNATGYYDTNYKGKAEYGLESLKKKDFVFIHVEAPDEAGHNADLRAKISVIEKFDMMVVGTILEYFRGRSDFRIMVLPDHYTPLSVRTHTADPVLFAMYGEGIEPDEIKKFNELAASDSHVRFDKGYELMERFIKHNH